MTRFALSPDSRVLVDLRVTGLLRALGHNPTMVAHPETAPAFEAAEGDGGASATLALRFPVSRIDPPAELSPDDRHKMRANMEAPEVLDAARFPSVDVTARWRGTMHEGQLEVRASIRGRSHALTMDVALERAGADLLARGTWEGRLTDLGIKPFRALMGALKLQDWVRLRLEARLSAA